MLLDTHSARRTKPFTPAVTAGIPQEPNANLPFQTAFAGDPLHALLTKALTLQGPGSPGLFRPPPTHLGVGVFQPEGGLLRPFPNAGVDNATASLHFHNTTR